MRHTVSVLAVLLSAVLVCATTGAKADIPLHSLDWCRATFVCNLPTHPVMGLYTIITAEIGYACVCSSALGECKGLNGNPYCYYANLPHCPVHYVGERQAAEAGGTYGYCHTCEDGYQLSNHPYDSPKCWLCSGAVAHCALCSSDGVCSSCESGYTLSPDKKTCFDCSISGCTSCSANRVCSTCNSGYTLSTDKKSCFSCSIANCQGCTANGLCGSCKPGYVLSADKRSCLRCDDAHCELCSSTSTCERCADGYTLSSDKRHCFECGVGGCSGCSADGVCAGCEAGLTLAADQRSCFTCALDGCATCAHTDVCGACAPGYVLSDGGLCGVCDVARCAQCISPGDGHRCATCTKGYKTDKKSGECVAGGVAWWVWLLVAVATAPLAVLIVVLVFWCDCDARKNVAVLHAEEDVPMLRKAAPPRTVNVADDDKEPDGVPLERVPSQRRRRVSIGGEIVLGTNAPAMPQYPSFYTDTGLPAGGDDGGQQQTSFLSIPFSQGDDELKSFASVNY